jgi:hypothetical protein
MKNFLLVFLILLAMNKAESQSLDSFFSNIGNELLVKPYPFKNGFILTFSKNLIFKHLK